MAADCGLMSIIVNVPSANVSTIKHLQLGPGVTSYVLIEQTVACRTVRRLTQCANQGPELFP